MSDHIPVYAVKKQQPHHFNQKEIERRSHKNYSSVATREHLSGLDWSNVTESHSAADSYAALEEVMTDHLNNTCPIKSFKVPAVQYDGFTNAVLTLIKKRKRNLRRARRVPIGEYNIYTARACRLMKLINKTVAENQKTLLLSELEKHKRDPKRFWTIVNNLWKGGKEDTKISLIDCDGQRVSEEETANYINSYYSSIGAKLAMAFRKHTTDGPATPC